MSTEADIVMNFEASAAVGAVICSLGGTPVNANHIEYWKAQATKARQQSVGLAAKIIEMQAEITKLRAERDAAADRIGVLHDDIIALANKNESLQAAAREMRERAAHAGYVACAETRHVTLGNAVSRAIMSLPVTSAVLATEGGGE